MNSPGESEKLIEGLLAAFDKATLEEILSKDLDKRIWEFVPDKELFTYVVKAAEEHDWTSALIDAALKNKPNDAVLKKIAVLDPLELLVTNPPQKSTASGGEVARVVNALLQVLDQGTAKTMSPQFFTELNNNLADLYEEFKTQSAGITP